MLKGIGITAFTDDTLIMLKSRLSRPLNKGFESKPKGITSERSCQRAFATLSNCGKALRLHTIDVVTRVIRSEASKKGARSTTKR